MFIYAGAGRYLVFLGCHMAESSLGRKRAASVVKHAVWRDGYMAACPEVPVAAVMMGMPLGMSCGVATGITGGLGCST